MIEWPNGEDCPCGRCMSIRGMYVAPASNAVAACPSCGSTELVSCPRTHHHDAECIAALRNKKPLTRSDIDAADAKFRATEQKGRHAGTDAARAVYADHPDYREEWRP